MVTSVKDSPKEMYSGYFLDATSATECYRALCLAATSTTFCYWAFTQTLILGEAIVCADPNQIRKNFMQLVGPRLAEIDWIGKPTLELCWITVWSRSKFNQRIRNDCCLFALSIFWLGPLNWYGNRVSSLWPLLGSQCPQESWNLAFHNLCTYGCSFLSPVS